MKIGGIKAGFFGARLAARIKLSQAHSYLYTFSAPQRFFRVVIRTIDRVVI